MSDIKRLIRETTAAPLGQIIASVGQGVAQAQRALDEQALAQLEALYQEGDEAMALLRRSGWQPTFYTLPETEGEVKVALTLSGQGHEAMSQSGAARAPGAIRRKKIQLHAAPLDAGYQNRYGYQASIGATLRFRIVPVPPPAGLDDLPIMAVPRLISLDINAARELLLEFRLELEVDPNGSASGVVARQLPAPGEMVRGGDRVTVTLHPQPGS